MIFTPYPDESRTINTIHKFRNENYALIRMTFTMIDKNIVDANGILRDLLNEWSLVDYSRLDHGRENGISYNTLFIQNGKTESVKLSFYRTNNARGDRRFSIQFLKRRMLNRDINEGDLLYISVFTLPDKSPQLFFINLTHNVPSPQNIMDAIGIDPISKLFEQLKPRLWEIIHGDFFDNSKGIGHIAPKDVGDTLEHLLGIETNNRNDADFNGLIEIKAKGARTRDTLFTLRPHFEHTRVAQYEAIDRNRVSAFARLYGYDSDAHPGYSNLYITIGSYSAPQNNQGFYLHVDDEHCQVNLIWTDPLTGEKEIAAFWPFNELKKVLYTKHPATLWFKAISRKNGNMIQFKYNEIEFSRAPQFTTFLTLIKSGAITYDWRGYISKNGKYVGKSHGNAWRIKPAARAELFGEIETINWEW